MTILFATVTVLAALLVVGMNRYRPSGLAFG
jgi:hypothetical protein